MFDILFLCFVVIIILSCYFYSKNCPQLNWGSLEKATNRRIREDYREEEKLLAPQLKCVEKDIRDCLITNLVTIYNSSPTDNHIWYRVGPISREAQRMFGTEDIRIKICAHLTSKLQATEVKLDDYHIYLLICYWNIPKWA